MKKENLIFDWDCRAMLIEEKHDWYICLWWSDWIKITYKTRPTKLQQYFMKKFLTIDYIDEEHIITKSNI